MTIINLRTPIIKKNYRKRKSNHLLFSFVIAFFIYTNVYSTWSIIAVDRKTGEIGIAAASCTFDVQGIASIVPGKGAIVVQAASSYFARIKGVGLMRDNMRPEKILEAMRNKEFDPENQQYGVIVLHNNESPLIYSGKLIKDWSGSKTGNDFAVLGNILVSENVINKAYEAFEKAKDKPLAERLMLALKAGEQAGGDKRCGSQYAASAFISVYGPKDDAILKLSIYGMKKGGKPAVTLLNEQFEYWRKENERKE